MADESFSTIYVAPHPATFLQPSISKKKSYVPPKMRAADEKAEPTFDVKNFPSLSPLAPTKDFPSSGLNYLSKMKEAEARQLEEAFYDPEKIASMTIKQLVKEGWLVVNADGTFIGDQSPVSLSPMTFDMNSQKPPRLPFHSDFTRRRLMSKKPSYTDLYEMDFDDSEGAIVPMIEEDDDSSV